MLENGNGLMKAIELANSNLSDEEFVIEYAKLSGLDDLSNEMETNWSLKSCAPCCHHNDY